MRILVADKLSDAGVAALADGHDVDVKTGLTTPELLATIPDYDAVVVRSATAIDADVIAAGTNLKVIGRAGVGLDNVDIAAATEAGVIVCNAPQSNIISAAEHTMALITSSARNIPQAHAALVTGSWERNKWSGTELFGKTLGILGLGRIGSLVAQRAAGFGMRLVAYDPFVSPEQAARKGVELRTTVEEVLVEADVLTIHLPRNADTVGLLDAGRLAKMKSTARLVNVARGGIVVEEDLADALRDGVIAGAALDVFDAEPTTSSPLFDLSNVVVTPHLGASTTEAQDKAGTQVAEAVKLALAGEFVPTAVNVEGGPVDEDLKPYLGLGEVLGRVFAGLSDASGGEISIEYVGDIAARDTSSVGLAVMRGALAPGCSQPVTFVNAPLLARDRGLKVRETTAPDAESYVSLVRVEGHDRGGNLVRVAGTVLSSGRQRLVEVWSSDMDIEPSEHMAFFRYADRPGVMGAVGTMLGRRNVNIAAAQVGRVADPAEAVMALALDAAVAPGVLEEIGAEIGADTVRSVTL
ncbi:MAG TPA: phosphoglycerate dehydrogenase [Nitriliruptoraceae bacterium]|nr:phosphoglycerate dehydrogenase [Nitriliruptoraceae bacterium]